MPTDAQRQDARALQWFVSLKEIPAASGFPAMELIIGARKFSVRPLAVVWPSSADCDNARKLFATLRLSHRLELIDALIAATAVGLNAELCSNDIKHLRAVPDLKLLKPY